MFTKMIALFLIPLIASAAVSNPMKVATRPQNDGWRRGGGCVMTGDNLAILITVGPNASASRTNAAIWAIMINRDGTARGESYNQISTTNVDDIQDNAAITCLASGGSAFLHQLGTTVTLSFFNSYGKITNTITKTAFFDKACMGPTSDGGFVVSSVTNNGANSVEVYNADGTVRSTISLSAYPDWYSYVQRGKDGTVIVILQKAQTMILKFYDLDGKSVGTDLTFSVSGSGNGNSPITATLSDGKLVLLNTMEDPNGNADSFKYALYNSDLSLIKDYGTKTSAESGRYNLAALKDGGWAYSWTVANSRNGYLQIMNGDGSARTEPQLFDVHSGPFVVPYNDGSIFTIWYDQTNTDQFLWAVRLDPKGNQIAFGANCDNCPKETSQSYFTGSLRYDIPFDQFVSSNGEAKFIQTLMSILGLKVEQITILSVKAGSTIVDFKIKEDKSNTKAGDINAIKSNLQSAVNTNKVSVLNAQVLGFTSSDVVVAGVSKLQVAFGALIAALIALFY